MEKGRNGKVIGVLIVAMVLFGVAMVMYGGEVFKKIIIGPKAESVVKQPVEAPKPAQELKNVVLGQDIFARRNGERLKIGRLEISPETISFVSYGNKIVKQIHICIFNTGVLRELNFDRKICMLLRSKRGDFSVTEASLELPNSFYPKNNFYQAFAACGDDYWGSGEWYEFDFKAETALKGEGKGIKIK